jgi:hypothetical protein
LPCTRHILTKLGIFAGLVGASPLGAADPSVAKSHRMAGSVEQIPYNYTGKPSWFYPRYCCYGPYDVPGHDAYGSSYSCLAAV